MVCSDSNWSRIAPKSNSPELCSSIAFEAPGEVAAAVDAAAGEVLGVSGLAGGMSAGFLTVRGAFGESWAPVACGGAAGVSDAVETSTGAGSVHAQALAWDSPAAGA